MRTSLMIFAIERNFIVRASALRLSSLWPAFAPLLRFFITVSVIRVAKTFRRSPDMVPPWDSGETQRSRLQARSARWIEAF